MTRRQLKRSVGCRIGRCQEHLEIIDDSGSRMFGWIGEEFGVQSQGLERGALGASASLGHDEIVLSEGKLASKHHLIAFGFEMRRHGSAGGLAAFIEG